MKKLILLFAAILTLSGCAAIERAGDWVNDNPMVADVIVRQSVARYIQAGETPQEQSQRATDVKTVVERTTAYLDGNPQTTVDGIMAALDSNIAWDRLNPADKLLVQDIVLMVQIRLAEKQAEEQLSQETIIALRSLLTTAISAASLFI